MRTQRRVRSRSDSGVDAVRRSERREDEGLLSRAISAYSSEKEEAKPPLFYFSVIQ